MTISIQSGPSRVVAHGTVTVFRDNELSFMVPFDQVDYQTIVRFVDDDVDVNPHVRAGLAENTFIMELVNFYNADGKGSAEPVLIAEGKRADLYLHFRIFLFGKTRDRTVHYTFYELDKV